MQHIEIEMYNYMRALEHHFPGRKDPELERQIKAVDQQLRTEMTREQRRMLNDLIDLGTTLCEKTAFSSFVEGFRVAWGIGHELSMGKSYSYLKEEEQRIRGEAQ